MITSVLVSPLNRSQIDELSGRVLPASEYSRIVDDAVGILDDSIDHSDIALGFASLIFAVENRFRALMVKEEKLGELRYLYQSESELSPIRKSNQNFSYIIGTSEAMSCIDALVHEFDLATISMVLPYLSTRSVKLYEHVLANYFEIENELLC